MNAPVSTASLGLPPDSRRLWSLWDIMRRFRAASFAGGLVALSRAALLVQSAGLFGAGKDDDADRDVIREALNDARDSIAELPLSSVLRSQFERIGQRLEHADGAELTVMLREFHNNLMVEYSAAWFLMIFPVQREYYEQKKPPFGEPVAKAFPDAIPDIAAASRCFALDEWTACVFHLMRVLEHGLKTLAGRVGLLPEAMQHENWKNIIDQIEKKIGEMEGLPKSAEKIEKIRSLSEVATQFRYFKDAWRNHVSHGHVSYDEHSGPPIWIHVKAFMEHAAKDA